MRSILIISLLISLASPALAQVYSDLDLMVDQVRVTENNLEFSPRLTVGFENEDVGTRARYWHLNTTINRHPYSYAPSAYDDYRFHFDVLDLDVYKQMSGLRLFGGLRTGYLTFSELSSPTIPFFRITDDYSNNGVNTYYYNYPVYSYPVYSSYENESIKSAIFGPTAGLEGDVPIFGNLWIDYGARCSFLLANWYSSYSFTNIYYNNYANSRFADTLIVPEIYTGLEFRWTHAELGAKFEVQKWDSDRENYSYQSPTVVGIGATLGVRY